MKPLVIASLLCLAAAPVSAQGYGIGSNPSDHSVNGYTNGRGTYVEPRYQTNPNSTTLDNYGTSGNYNPHTGTYGQRSPY